MSPDELKDLQDREIYLQRVLTLLDKRFPRKTSEEWNEGEAGTLRDLVEAAYDIAFNKDVSD